MISIIIPIYNQADKLSDCLESILRQNYCDHEIIIINDGSIDNFQIVSDKYNIIFNEKNISFKIIYQYNQGAPVARNRGYRESIGEYLFFCDADTILYPNCLQDFIFCLNTNQDASYAYSSFYFGSKLFKLFKFSPEKLKKFPFITTMSLIKRNHFTGFDESLKKFQDWDLWLSMLEKGHTGVWVDKILFKVQTGGTMSNWLPSFAYKFFPFLSEVKKYKKSMEIIKKKHGLL